MTLATFGAATRPRRSNVAAAVIFVALGERLLNRDAANKCQNIIVVARPELGEAARGGGVRYNPEAIGKVAPDRLAKWALMGSGLITAIHAVTSLTLPFGWDHGIMASVGSSYVHGKLPYVDSWDMKGPVSY